MKARCQPGKIGIRRRALRSTREKPVSVSFVSPPPEAFNLAQHLLDANAGRPEKPAFVDDAGAITYAQLDERVRRLAAGLTDAGVKREERVLLLMQDTADWPVAFLGAILAGVAPVAVNTLLTADDLAYMLEHSRAQAVLVSGAVCPRCRPRSPNRITKSKRSLCRVPSSPAPARRNRVRGLPRPLPPLRSRRTPALTIPLSGSTRPARPKAKGDGAFACQSVLDDRALRQGDPRPRETESVSPQPSSFSPMASATR